MNRSRPTPPGLLLLVLAWSVAGATGCAGAFSVDLTIERGEIGVPYQVWVEVSVLEGAGGDVVASEERYLEGQAFFTGGVTGHLLIVAGRAGDRVRVVAEAVDTMGIPYATGTVEVPRSPGLVEAALTLEPNPDACPLGGTVVVVTTEVDELDAGDITAVPPMPEGAGLSLREAIWLANTQPGPWTIRFDAGLFPPATGLLIEVGGPGGLLGELPFLEGGNTCLDGTNAGVIISGVNLPLAGGPSGLTITSADNRILGLTVEDFPSNGILIDGTLGPAANNLIARCTIRSNDGDGIDVFTSGTVVIGPDNIVVGNAENGIFVENVFEANNRIYGNRIGLDDLIQPWGNGMYGIAVYGVADLVIGGDLPADGNWIGNSALDGLMLNGNGTTGVVVKNNFIGSDTSFVPDFGNLLAGIAIVNAAYDNVVGPGNVIAFNLNEGIWLQSSAVDNRITGNAITANVFEGILLSGGANASILPPVIDSLAFPNVTGTTGVVASGTVEIFADTGDEGRCLLSSSPVSDGAWSATLAVPLAPSCGGFLTATFTDAAGNTSAFSTPVQL